MRLNYHTGDRLDFSSVVASTGTGVVTVRMAAHVVNPYATHRSPYEWQVKLQRAKVRIFAALVLPCSKSFPCYKQMEVISTYDAAGVGKLNETRFDRAT